VTSPTARSLAYLRKEGWRANVVEQRVPHSNIENLVFIDILAIRDGEVLAVQTTSASNVSARIHKIESDELADALAEVRKAGWAIHVHGWKKPTVKRRTWELRTVDVS
jgi:Holliday junction resolvase